MTPEKLASIFHDVYEALAPAYGYETREETREFDKNSPNGKLMVAVCKFIIETELKTLIEEARREERDRIKQWAQNKKDKLIMKWDVDKAKSTVYDAILFNRDDFPTNNKDK